MEEVCKAVPAGETVFVSIASYRDPECFRTVFDCFEKAACPLRVFVGVCQQNYELDKDTMKCYTKLATKRGMGVFRSNLRVYTLSANDAKGPMFARATIEHYLYQGERYYMIVDSHMAFEQNWDQIAIDSLKEAASARQTSRAVLTMYPADFTRKVNRASRQEIGPPAYLRFKTFNGKSGLPEIEGPIMQNRPTECFPSLFWAACMSFAPAEMLKEVPYDPTLPYVFMGEEISMAARLWTHGWEMFAPKSMFVRHMWARKRPTFWEQFYGSSPEHQKRQEQEADSYRRLRVLMKTQAPIGAEDLHASKGYGLGSARRLEDYENYCGVNFLLQTVQPHARVGVSPNPSAEEIMCKFGSVGAYQTALHNAVGAR